MATRRRPRGVVYAGVSGALVLVLGALWLHVSATRAAAVEASWTPRCTGTTVGSYADEPEIRSRPGWRCEIALRIENRGGYAVRIPHVEAPLLGSGGGAEVQGLTTPDATVYDARAVPTGPAPDFDDEPELARTNDVDAVYDVDLVVPAHATRTVRLGVGWRPDGCNTAGHLWFSQWPTLVITSLHRTIRSDVEQSLRLRTYREAHDKAACPS